MSLSIRLSRGGAKKRPYYRIVVANSRSPRDGRFIERIGSYNPLLAKDDEKRVVLDVERAKHWVSVGAQPTDRVARFLDTLGVKERTASSNPTKGKPGEKAVERAEERASKAAAAEEAAREAAAAPAPAPAEPEQVAAEPEVAAEETIAAEPAVVEAAPEEAAPVAEEVAPVADEAAPVAEEVTPVTEASNEGESASAPVEGADEVAAPEEGSAQA